MKLNLVRPLAFIDLETTGIDIANDRIVQIAILKVFPDGREEIKQQKINPTVPIPLAASKVHGIYADDVKDKSTFAQVAPGLAKYIADSDFAGYNSNKFDIPLLVTEFSRAGIDFQLAGRKFIDVQSIFFQMEQRTLKAAYKFYCDEELTGAHDAENDIRATYEVFKSQLQRYENVEYEDKEGNLSYPIQSDLEVLAAFTPFNLLDPTNKIVYDDLGRETFNFGMHKGKTLVEVFTENPGYYTWMLNQNFSIFTKKALKQVWESMKSQAA